MIRGREGSRALLVQSEAAAAVVDFGSVVTVGGEGAERGGVGGKDHTKNVQSLCHGSVLLFQSSVSAFV